MFRDRCYFPHPGTDKIRGHPELNQGPLDLQSNALPLSYIPYEKSSALTVYNPISVQIMFKMSIFLQIRFREKYKEGTWFRRNFATYFWQEKKINAHFEDAFLS